MFYPQWIKKELEETSEVVFATKLLVFHDQVVKVCIPAGVSGFPSRYLPMILFVFLDVGEPDDAMPKLVVAEVVGGCCMKK